MAFSRTNVAMMSIRSKISAILGFDIDGRLIYNGESKCDFSEIHHVEINLKRVNGNTVKLEALNAKHLTVVGGCGMKIEDYLVLDNESIDVLTVENYQIQMRDELYDAFPRLSVLTIIGDCFKPSPNGSPDYTVKHPNLMYLKVHRSYGSIILNRKARLGVYDCKNLSILKVSGYVPIMECLSELKSLELRNVPCTPRKTIYIEEKFFPKLERFVYVNEEKLEPDDSEELWKANLERSVMTLDLKFGFLFDCVLRIFISSTILKRVECTKCVVTRLDIPNVKPTNLKMVHVREKINY